MHLTKFKPQFIDHCDFITQELLKKGYIYVKKTMIVIHQKEENRGRFIATEDDKQAGDMTYVWTGNDKIIADHTGVNPDFSGKGVGKKMLMEMVKFAREEKIKIIPLCPFVKSMFDKLEEIRDVL